MDFNVQISARADMHTHSNNSHDSVCSVEDMCLAQIERGTTIMAVTDHFSALEYTVNDSFESFCKVHRDIAELNKKYDGKCLILSGIEIGEGFANQAVCEKIMSLVDFDVIIGSVHKLRENDMFRSFSKTDFSKFTKKEIYGAIDTYLDDVILMVKSLDIDILAHLTYPLRYIVWKHNIDVDITRFSEKFKKIYEIIIKRNIALEVNTLHFGVMGDLNPTTELLKLYHLTGGELITLGSDAHNVEAASCYFGDAIKILKEIGFEKIYYFKNRKPYPLDI